MKIIGITVGTPINPEKINPIPPVTEECEGKVLAVENGALVFKKAYTEAEIAEALNTEVEV